MTSQCAVAAVAIATAVTFGAADADAQRRGAPRAIDVRQPVGLDRVFYDLAGEVPGFAGFWFDSTGTLVVSLKDPATHGAAAIAAARRQFEQWGREQPVIRLGPPVEYDFRQLYDWKAAYFVSPPSVGLTGAGVCEERNRVCVSIAPGRSIANAYRKADLLGIPRRALVVRVEPPIKVSGRRDST